MELRKQYNLVKEHRISGRYLPASAVDFLLDEISDYATVSVIGVSENDISIKAVEIGNGPKRVLAWSQMHGNESTTTKALFDFFNVFQKFSSDLLVKSLLETHTFFVIPVLNPDGAKAYTRENINEVDLNRDAVLQSQSESKVLWSVFNKFKPHLCLNLHDQRTIYSLPNKNPAALSFLAPSADEACSLTPARLAAIDSIVTINHVLQEFIPGKVGRYDDAFNINCFGDSFQAEGVPTILFEAGHFPNDYQREKTREYVFLALCALFGLITPNSKPKLRTESYFSIPQNKKRCRDVLLQNVMLNGNRVDIALQFDEQLIDNTIQFIPKVDIIGDLKDYFGHKEIDFKGEEILINSHENVFESMNVSTIHIKKSKKSINI